MRGALREYACQVWFHRAGGIGCWSAHGRGNLETDGYITAAHRAAGLAGLRLPGGTPPATDVQALLLACNMGSAQKLCLVST